MRKLLVLLLLFVMMASCMNHYCPTYGRHRQAKSMSASAKKVKPSKGKKMAERERMKFAETE